MRHLPPTPDKGAIKTQVAHARAGILGITLGDKFARGRARRITVMITVAGARGIDNISKEQQQKGGLKGGLKSEIKSETELNFGI